MRLPWFQTQLSTHAQHRLHVPMGQGPNNRHPVVETVHHHASLEQGPHPLHQSRRHMRQVGKGPSAHPLPLSPHFTQENGGRRVPVGNGIDR